MSFIFGTGVSLSRLPRPPQKQSEKKSGWSITFWLNSSFKPPHRYVAFDRLGTKIITGISNLMPLQSQWDRPTISVPAANQFPTVSLAVTTTSRTTTSTVQPSPRRSSTVVAPSGSEPTERERSMAFCYRNLMTQYNQLVRRYFNLSRSRVIPTVITMNES